MHIRGSFRSVILAALVVVGFTPAAVFAQALVVNSFDDEADVDGGDGMCLSAGGVCTLRAAIQQANATAGVDQILVAVPGTYRLTIAGIGEDAGETGDLDITDDVTISGVNPTETIIDADGLDRVFHIRNGAQVQLLSMTIRRGLAPLGEVGGGIWIESAIVFIRDTVIRNNETEEGFFEGGGIANTDGGSVFVLRSSLISNLAFCGGGIYNDGLLAQIENVTFSHNDAACAGGGLLDVGEAGQTVVVNSSFVDNIPENIAGTQDTLHLANTLMVPAAGFDNCFILSGFGNIDDGGNFAGTLDCDTILATTGADQVQNLTLDAASGHFVHRPLLGNPAIDGSDPAECATLIEAVDQRSVTRPQNGTCDSGAVEIRTTEISSGAPAGASWNTAYVHTVTATGEGPLSFTLQEGTLPTGFTLSTAGVISGTSTVLGLSEITIRLTGGLGETVDQITSINVTGTAASVTGAPTGATWNVAYTFSFGGTGNGALSYAITDGSLPVGLSMSSGGVVSGTPIGIVSVPFTVTVTDATSLTASIVRSIPVSGTAASVSGSPNAGTWNTAYSFTFGGTGNGTLTFTRTSGSLPAGLSLSSAGAITGTPTGVGLSSFRVTVTDQTGQTSNLDTSITVNGATTSISGTPPAATWGTPYSFAFTGTGNGTLSYARTAGALPAGLSLSSAGAITGTATALGPSNFTVTVTDQTAQTAPLITSIVVNGTAASVAGTPPSATWGTAYNFAFTGTGNGTLTFTQTGGALPAGLSLSPAGVITGTPTGLGASSFTVTVTDATSQTSSLPTSITVNGTAASVTGTPPAATWGAAYSFAFTGAGNGTLSYAVTAGSLPAGLSLSSAGAITGTPSGLGPSSFTVTVTDATSQTSSLPTSITVNGTAASIAGTPPAATWGVAYNFGFTGTGNGALTYAITAGALPAGLSLSSTGVVFGIPTGLGTSSFTVTLTDITSQTAPRPTSIVVTGTPITLTGDPVAATVNTSYAFTFTATGNGTLTFSLASGVLPPGMIFSGGMLTGTPLAAGSFPLTVRVTDASAQSTTRPVTLIVQEAPPSPGPAPPPPAGNTAPTVAGLNNLTIEENRPIAPIAITLADDSTSPDQLTISVVPGDATILSQVSLTGSGSTRTLNLTLAEDREGQASVSISVSDGSLSTTATAGILVTPAPVPDPPTGLTAVPDGTALLFSWRAPIGGAVPTFFVLEGGHQSGLVTLPVVNTGRATSFRTFVPAGTWFFRVRSGNSAGVSIPSAEITGTVGPGVTHPGAPHGLVASVDGALARLAWQPPVDGGPVSAWQIEVGSRPGLSDRAVLRIPPEIFAVQSPLDPGNYVARVRGVGPAGDGTASNETSFIVGAVERCALGVADPPVLLPATVANRLVTLMWRPPTNSAVGSYRILVGSAPGLENLATFAVGAVTSFAAVAPPGQYYVTLVATNDCGTSLPSNTILVVVP